MEKSITMESLLALIKDVSYAHFHSTQTVCCLLLENGFTVIGESACVDPDIYDEEIGNQIAKDDAINNMWALEGYRLKNELYRG